MRTDPRHTVGPPAGCRNPAPVTNTIVPVVLLDPEPGACSAVCPVLHAGRSSLVLVC